VLADKENLYIAVLCETKDLGKILCDKKTRDDEVWKDEVVDMFIDPKNTGGSDYFHIIVNSAGITQEGKGQSDSSWNPLLTVKCAIEPKKAWVMEIKIPLKELDIDSGTINTVWSFNVTRTWRDPDDSTIFEDLAWSPTETRTSHVPSMFGYLWVNAGE
jgi:hypothetical protein